MNADYVVAGLGALGSATCHELARRGHRVVGLERFELGHARGASHDTSRILRHSYHTPSYVRLTQEAYADWARLERDSGEVLVTVVGGLDLFPPGAAIDAVELWDLVNRQDWAICASVQRGMSSRSYRHGWFAPMEDDSLDIRRWLLPRLEERG